MAESSFSIAAAAGDDDDCALRVRTIEGSRIGVPFLCFKTSPLLGSH